MTSLHLFHDPTDLGEPSLILSWIVGALGLGMAPVMGYALLSRYPRTVLKLRRYLQDIMQGELPENIELIQSENDIRAIQNALTMIVGRLKQKARTFLSSSTTRMNESA